MLRTLRTPRINRPVWAADWAALLDSTASALISVTKVFTSVRSRAEASRPFASAACSCSRRSRVSSRRGMIPVSTTALASEGRASSRKGALPSLVSPIWARRSRSVPSRLSGVRADSRS